MKTSILARPDLTSFLSENSGTFTLHCKNLGRFTSYPEKSQVFCSLIWQNDCHFSKPRCFEGNDGHGPCERISVGFKPRGMDFEPLLAFAPRSFPEKFMKKIYGHRSNQRYIIPFRSTKEGDMRRKLTWVFLLLAGFFFLFGVQQSALAAIRVVELKVPGCG